MKKHLHLVQDLIAYNTFKASNDYIEPNVTLIKSEGHCSFNPYTGSPSGSETGSGSGSGSGNNQHNYAMDYFTIIPQYTGLISISSVSNISLEYSMDDASTWTTIYNDECSQLIEWIDVNNGDKILFRGQIHPSAGSGSGNGSESVTFSYPSNLFHFDDDYNIEGNIMSLIYGDSFLNYSNINLNDVDGNGTIIKFQNMFSYDTHIINAENLSLPATTLVEYCYQSMFLGCSSLTLAPSILPATTLANSCYNQMFYNCTALTTAPALPATTLADNCYESMFLGCSSLTLAPSILPATTLANYCYYQMFSGCTSLTTTPALPATTLTSSCYSYMFDCCSSLITAPELPATTLAGSCYSYMFDSCTSLNYIKCLATDISASNCTYYWLNNVASTGTFVKADNMNNWEYGTEGIPFGWAKISNSELPIAWDYTSSYPINSPIKPKLMNPNLPVTYSSSNISIATIDNSGNVTFVSEGIVTLTAVFAGNETYQAKTTTCQIQITAYDYACNYLTIESLEDNNTIGWKAPNSNLAKVISVSTDNGQTWINKIASTSTSGTALATLNNGDKLLIKGSNTTYGTSSYYNYFRSTGNFNVEGNIMSLLYGDNFIGETSLSEKDYAFKNLFYNTKLINAQNLKLPATTLAILCYGSMFSGCSSLTTAPDLPATSLADTCYYNMFQGCTSLATAPALPATTLANRCYQSMFSGCTSLTIVPELPATILANECYASMFYGCTSLITTSALSATTLAPSCYYYMFSNCTSLATALALPATTLASNCYHSMFKGCTSLTTAPALPATTLASNCYHSMFEGCTSLTTAPALPATTLVTQCYPYMFEDCTSLTSAPELPATTLASNCYIGIFKGCTSLNYIKCLATDISATNCTTNWVNGVASTGIFVKDPNMTSWTTGNDGIPSGWTVQDAS